MAPLIWDDIMMLKLDTITDDVADDFYPGLAAFNPENEKEATKLLKLFRVTQTIMQVKAGQAEIALEELEKMAEREGQMSAKKERELLNQIQELQLRLKSEKNEAESGTRDSRFLRDDFRELERQRDIHHQQTKDTERELANEKRNSEKLLQRAEEAEKENQILKRECEQLHHDLRDLHHQFESAHDSLLARKDEEAFVEKFRAKNKELIEAVDQVEHLKEINNKNLKQISELKYSLEESVKQMEITTDEVQKMKDVLKHSDAAVDSLNRECDLLKAEISDLTKRFQQKSAADEAIIISLQAKIEEWKKIVVDKNTEISHFESTIVRLRDQPVSSSDGSKSMSSLKKVLREKDDQIKILQQQLTQAVHELESNAGILENFQLQQSKTSTLKESHFVKDLAYQLKEKEIFLKDSACRVHQAEGDALEKDRQLTEALLRLKEYEDGEYGLADAVAEVKTFKSQVKIRDRQIEELIQKINKLEEGIDSLADENEELRERLGLAPKTSLDLSDVRKKKVENYQQEYLMNQVLQKEVERLEEDKIELKKQLKKLSERSSTPKSSPKNVTLSEPPKHSTSLPSHSEIHFNKSYRQIIVEVEELKLRNKQIESDLEHKQGELDALKSNREELSIKIKVLEHENSQLQLGMKEILQTIKEHKIEDSQNGDYYIYSPTLEKILSILQSGSILEEYDYSTLHIKAQVDNLQGRNEELRNELKKTRQEANKAIVDFNRMQSQVENLVIELKLVKESGSSNLYIPYLHLPINLTPSSNELISSLNTHLINVLQDLSQKEKTIAKLQEALENDRRKFAVMRHQQGLLYQEYLEEKKCWKETNSKLRDDKKNFELVQETSKVQLQEFDHLIEMLSKDEVEVRQRIADVVRKIAILRVNEKKLSRKFKISQEVEDTLRKENLKLKNEMISMENCVKERIGYLQRHKDMTSFKIASLQKALEDSVPVKKLEAANRQYNEVTCKYRDLLERENALVTQLEMHRHFEQEVKRLQNENNILKKELEIEKEKLITMEAIFEILKKEGDMIKSNLEVGSFCKKIAILEMKELHERQRAEHASLIYQQQKDTLRKLEDRNVELEQKFSELSKINLQLQNTESELRDELSNCVTRETNDNNKKRIGDLEKAEVYLKNEVSKLKDMAEVAQNQVEALENMRISQDKELCSLRQQLVDIQAQSDDQAMIGKLHRQIVTLQASERIAVRKHERSQARIKVLEAQLLRLEEKWNEKEQFIFHIRNESINKNKYLKDTIQDLRRKFSGALPLVKQEKFSLSVIQLMEDKVRIQTELEQAIQQREHMEEKFLELEFKNKSLEELMLTIKDGVSAKKLTEWHEKLEALRLQDLKKTRLNDKLQQKVKHHEDEIRNQERIISNLDADNALIAKECEERQLLWEQREIELERNIIGLEKQISEVAGYVSKVDQGSDDMPDSKLSVINQLEQALTTVRKNKKTISELQTEIRMLKKHILQAENSLKEEQHKVVTRDKIINDLHLNVLSTSQQDVSSEPKNSYETQQALKVAQTVVATLKARIAQKQETIKKYQELVKQAQEEIHNLGEIHQTDLRQLQEKLQAHHDMQIGKFKQAALAVINKPALTGPTNRQLARLNELEDLIKEQSSQQIVVDGKLRDAETEIIHLKEIMDLKGAEFEEEKESLRLQLEDEHSKNFRKISGDLETYRSQLATKQLEIDSLQTELESIKNHPSPSANLKQLIDKLKSQLTQKEKQLQALNKALSDLRSDMVEAAKDTVKVHSEDNTTLPNIQKLIDKETQVLKNQVEEEVNKNVKLLKDLKKAKEKERKMILELEKLHMEANEKEINILKLKADKQQLEKELEDLKKKKDRVRSKAFMSLEDVQPGDFEDLNKKIKMLEMHRINLQVPGKSIEIKGRNTEVANEKVIRWEESKKWQITCEKLKTTLKEREQENENLQKKLSQLKDALSRADKDKMSLESKLKVTKQKPKGSDREEYHKLMEKNSQLNKEIEILKQKLDNASNKTLQQLQEENKLLGTKLHKLEECFHKQSEKLNSRNATEEEQNLHKQILKLTDENLILKLEGEQAKTDVPRLKDKINSLETLVEVLKEEKNGSQKSPKFKVNGRGVLELEKTIIALKKVIENLQKENESLKNKSHSDAFEISDEKISTENVKKLISENERLRKEFKKEQELSGQLKIKITHLGVSEQELRDAKNKLEDAYTKITSLPSRDSQSYRNAMVSRIYGEKIKTLESELDKKNKVLNDVRMVLRDAAAREQDLLHEKAQLLEKIDTLKSFPSSITTNEDLTKEFQNLRLTIKKLEDEKEQLLKEIKGLREQLNFNSDGFPTDVMLDKLKQYDKILAENVELRTELKTLKLEKDQKQKDLELMKRELLSVNSALREEVDQFRKQHREAVDQIQQSQEKLLDQSTAVNPKS